MADKFERFTPSALRSLALAQEFSQRFNHLDIGSEHLLLGILREGTSTATNTLRARQETT